MKIIIYLPKFVTNIRGRINVGDKWKKLLLVYFYSYKIFVCVLNKGLCTTENKKMSHALSKLIINCLVIILYKKYFKRPFKSETGKFAN